MEVAAFLLLPKSPFGQAHHETTTNRVVEGNFAKVKNRTIEADIMHNMVGNKTANGTAVSQVSKVLHQNLAPLSRKFPELTIEESLTNVHPRSGHFICSKGYVIPFLKISVQRAIPKQVATSKTQELLIDQEIMEMLDKRAIKKRGTSILRSIPEQYSTGKKEG